MYVKPKSNFRIARYKLRECKQTDSEPVDVFVKRLRTILAECKYPVPERPWQIVGADYFMHSGKDYISSLWITTQNTQNL